ncbi:MAG: hypothetical protein KC621_33960 [Myxococcales bacterium]|nr:hypothetical protein [Myxococcales bacterium]
MTLEICHSTVVMWGMGDPVSSVPHGPARIVAADARWVGDRLLYAFLLQPGHFGFGMWRASRLEEIVTVSSLGPVTRGSVVLSPAGFLYASNGATRSIHGRLFDGEADGVR